MQQNIARRQALCRNAELAAIAVYAGQMMHASV